MKQGGMRLDTEATAMRTIAGFEAVKGAVALAASLGFLSLLHHDLHRIAAALIGHIGLQPGDHYPALILNDIDKLRDARLQTLLLIAGGYVLLRFTEAWGLWHTRRWGEWLGALSGALYIPFEAWHFLHRPSFWAAAVILLNVAVVGFLAWRLQSGDSRGTPDSLNIAFRPQPPVETRHRAR